MKPEEVGKYMGEIGKGVKDLALQMKQPVEEVYELFLRQNYVQAVINIFEIVVFAIVWVYFIKFIKWGLKKDKYDNTWFDNHSDVTFITIVLGTIFTVLSIIVFIAGTESTITRLINPNYATIKDIIELVKPK